MAGVSDFIRLGYNLTPFGPIFTAGSAMRSAGASAIAQGVEIRGDMQDLGIGAAYQIGQTAGTAQSSATGVADAVKWAAIAAGVVIGGLIILKGLDTVKEVFVE